MDKLKQLLARSKCGVSITVNKHRDVYMTATQHIDDAKDMECLPEIAADVRAKMIETNTIVEIQFYPDTPVGYFEIWHHDIDAALDQALECLD